MPNANTVILMGHLTRDIEIKHTPSGKVVGKGGIAVNNGYGENKKVCFVDFTCFGNTAEAAAKHLSKGSAAYLEGNLDMQEWKDKNTGAQRTKHAIVARTVQFIGGKTGGGQESSSQYDRENDEIPF